MKKSSFEKMFDFFLEKLKIREGEKGGGGGGGLPNTPMVFEGSILVFAGSSGFYFCESHF